MIFVIYFFKKKLSFSQHPFPDIKDGKMDAANIAIVPKIEPPFCWLMFLNLDKFNCFLMTVGNLFNILFILSTSDCDKLFLK